MNRRKFLKGAAALFCAPAIVKAENIMTIQPPGRIMRGISSFLAGPTQHDWHMDHLKPIEASIDVYVGDFHTMRVVPHDQTKNATHRTLVCEDNGNLYREKIVVTSSQPMSAADLDREIRYQIERKAKELERDILLANGSVLTFN